MRLGDIRIGELLSANAESNVEKVIDNGPYAPVHILDRIQARTIRELHERLSRLRVRICGYEHERSGKTATSCPMRPYNLVCGHSHSYPEKTNGAAQIVWDAMVFAKLMGVLPSEMEQLFRSLGDGDAIIDIPAFRSLHAEDYSAEARYREFNRPSISSFFLKRLIDELLRKRKIHSLHRSLVLLQRNEGQELLRIRDQLLEILAPFLEVDIPGHDKSRDTYS